MKAIVTLVAWLCLAVGALAASGPTTITFDSLTGSNADPFPGLVVGNFVITPTSGEWLEAHANGRPVPSIFGVSATGVVTVTENSTGRFNFFSVELDHAGGGTPGTYTIEGFLGGASIFAINGTMPLNFGTISNPDSSRALDAIQITMRMGSVTYNIDNLIVQSIPEPSAMALSLAAVGSLAASRRRLTRSRNF